MYGLKQNRDRATIAAMVSKVEVPHFEPKSGIQIDVNDSEAQSRANDGNVG